MPENLRRKHPSEADGVSQSSALPNQEAGDMLMLYKQWDHISKQCLELQEALNKVCP